MKPKKNNGNNQVGHNVNMIMPSTTFKGDLKTEADIRFDGKLDGTLQCTQKVVLGETAVITGDIKCREADIAGKVKGKIFVEELIILRETARVEGEITTKKISIEPGAIFDGSCKMIFDEQKDKEQK